jgi:glycosyltransferase involved in cell wall biosynthesis
MGYAPKMRCAVLAAFPFPLPQGSQVYVCAQARALARAGARVTLLCYGHGVRGDGDGTLAALETAGVTLAPAPAGLSRTRLATGPSLGKPLADAALLAKLLAEHRRRRFDVVLAHNVEACAVALTARAATDLPVVYVAHTLFGEELSSYLPGWLARSASRLGHHLDRRMARGADAVVALSAAAETRLRAAARGPVERIAPALDPAPAPAPAAVEAACRRHGLGPGGFAVYAGNLDAYQDLALLAQAARLAGDGRVVALTHDAARATPPGLRVIRVAGSAEARLLLFGAGLAVVPRRIVGGFPIKLLNYMEAARAIVAFEDVAEGFVHRHDAWLLPRHADARLLAGAITQLLGAPELAHRIGQQGRLRLERSLGWDEAAQRTLALLAGVVAARGRRAPSLALPVRRSD